MRNFLYIKLILLCTLISAQPINWTDISASQNLPAAVKLFAGERSSPALKAWYLEVDLSDTNYVILPYLSSVGSEGIVPFSNRVGAVAAINGGYFNVINSTSVSSVVIREDVLAQNLSALNRNGTIYPVTRSFVSFADDGTPAIDWIYHFDNTFSGLYKFTSPTQNSPGNPAPVPNQTNGSMFAPLRGGLGGGPTLVKSGLVDISYNEEVFWDSGIGLDVENPRTAVGFTANNTVIMLVVDGRQPQSNGFTLVSLAALMRDLGCVEAMNLDGGGSSQLAATGTLINRPEGGTFQRPVPTILAIVHRDSLPNPQPMGFEDIIDTGDSRAELLGGGWFQSANPGFYGSTPSELNSIGSGDKTAVFRPNLGFSDSLDVYAWWVAAGNRSMDTPVVIKHMNGRDTVRVDQSVNGSTWAYIGSWIFSGDSSDAIIISNAASTGSFVVADAIRLTGDAQLTGIDSPTAYVTPSSNVLRQNYPNPFNPSTTLSWTLNQSAQVTIEVFNTLGQKVDRLFNARQSPGDHSLIWNITDNTDQASGIYLIRMQATDLNGKQYISCRKALLIR